MNDEKIYEMIIERLKSIHEELASQMYLSRYDKKEFASYKECLDYIPEFIDAYEHGLSYEFTVNILENYPATLSGKNAIYLLELGLLMGFKTEADEDKIFNLHLND
jgi:hypothetical protein